MKATAAAQQVSPELDVLRGFAALLMVVNHAGLQWLSPQDAEASLSGVAVFLGSLAPVVFFFVTGFGTALSLSARATPAPLGPLFARSGLLVIADQFFAWSQHAFWVLDFFSFIALTALVVGMLSRLKRPALACAVLTGVLLVARYVVGPPLTRSVDLPPGVEWLIGVRGVDHVSYPLSPWLIYPLLGMMSGLWFGTTTSERPLRFRGFAVAGAAAAALLAASIWMASRGREMFRWGTVSSSYFVFSLAILLTLSVVAVLLARRTPRVAGLLALSGIASFALIPLHYALIGASSLLLSGQLPLNPWHFGGLVLALVISCFAVSKFFAKAMQRPGVTKRRGWLYPLLLFALAALAVCTWTVPAANPRQALLEAVFGQMIIAGLLAMRARGRSDLLPTVSPARTDKSA